MNKVVRTESSDSLTKDQIFSLNQITVFRYDGLLQSVNRSTSSL